MIAAARSLDVPITTRSGRMKSPTADPSRRNSGFDTTSKAIFLLWVLVLWLGVPKDSAAVFSWHAFLIDSENPMWPLTVQVVMWFGFFYSMAELLLRWLYVLGEEVSVAQFSVSQFSVSQFSV